MSKKKATIDNEAFYDERIAPLMAQIIELCKERNIPHVCTFQLQDKEAEDGDPLLCSTVRIHPDDTAPCLIKAWRIIRPEPEVFAFTIVTGPAKPHD